MWEALWELNRKTSESSLRVFDGHRPFLGNMPQRQIEQFEHSIIIRK
jgi:hypothetical protein